VFCTRTIDAPTSAVWPLAGAGRVRQGRVLLQRPPRKRRPPSAERILEEFQAPRLGDWVPMFGKVNDTTVVTGDLNEKGTPSLMRLR
jgi:hypothetical protein